MLTLNTGQFLYQVLLMDCVLHELVIYTQLTNNSITSFSHQTLYCFLMCSNTEPESETSELYEIQSRSQYCPWPSSEQSFWTDKVRGFVKGKIESARGQE